MCGSPYENLDGAHFPMEILVMDCTVTDLCLGSPMAKWVIIQY